MNSYEKAAIIGYHRSGATNEEIGFIMGISSFYAAQIKQLEQY